MLNSQIYLFIDLSFSHHVRSDTYPCLLRMAILRLRRTDWPIDFLLLCRTLLSMTKRSALCRLTKSVNLNLISELHKTVFNRSISYKGILRNVTFSSVYNPTPSWFTFIDSHYGESTRFWSDSSEVPLYEISLGKCFLQNEE